MLDYRNPHSFVNTARRKRFLELRPVLDAVANGRGLHLLDIGGTWHYWKLLWELIPSDFRVTLLNLKPVSVPGDQTRVVSVTGDARAPDFEFQSFDFIFSNSLIEHLGSREAMGTFADRVNHSGLPYYIQTPSKWFPLEPHCRIPFFQFFPRSLRAWMIWNFRIKYFPRAETLEGCKTVSDSTIMLSAREMKALFPEAELKTERLLGLPKSYAVTRVYSR